MLDQKASVEAREKNALATSSGRCTDRTGQHFGINGVARVGYPARPPGDAPLCAARDDHGAGPAAARTPEAGLDGGSAPAGRSEPAGNGMGTAAAGRLAPSLRVSHVGSLADGGAAR